MKIQIISLKVTDLLEKKSKTVSFSDGVNLLTSDNNSRGKSVLMKSLYHAFGADSMFDSNIKQENIIFDINFSYGSSNYRILRFKGSFCTFKNNKFLNYYPFGSRDKLSEFYQNELGMGVYLRDKKVQMELAPPAFMFVPYYLDQDRSWKDEQYPFTKASMNQYFSTARNELFFYNLDLYKKEYGTLKAEIDNLESEINSLKNDRNQIDKSYRNIKEALSIPHINLNKDEIDNYERTTLNIINALLEKQNSLTIRLNELDEKKVSCLVTINGNNHAIDKINNQENPSLMVTCPLCNGTFDLELKTTIINTYNTVLLENENASLNEEVAVIEKQIEETKKEIESIIKEIESARNAVSAKKVELENYFSWLALSKLEKEQFNKMIELGNRINALDISKREKIKLKNSIKESTTEAKNYFIEQYKNILIKLGIDDFDPESIKPFYKLPLSGSQYARSTLSLFFGFINTKNKFNPNNYNWPLVIDSPREGEQDNLNSSKILKFIIEQDTSNHQCIVASVNATDYLSDEDVATINVIKLDNPKNHVMSEDEYDEDYCDTVLSFFKRI